ncbi:hypothetical protein EDEG_02808 [Edhazardia aedis USNM 41457]|uniref:Protein YIF1 n=1 Tax=Edhazardia aedis (strain USNM 41457) TaxID=1003232 RepID=J9DN58_EDHAE|nr:hypothetical protein EDEG_02808 [Edhazardia aedis USNM 41457]|eukprot:EJW02812.1 hypothetical protein EDEG_02808 [Edhazardia aedis USNM 41457]
MDIEIGHGALNIGKEYVNKGFQKVKLSTLNPYFNVSNKYILNKLLLIVYPFNNKHWHQYSEYPESVYYNSEDPKYSNYSLQQSNFSNDCKNKTDPDLYIPLMSLFTYILLMCTNFGLQQKFTPEFITKTFIRCLSYEIIQAILVSLISYFMEILEISILDFLSFSGYKFVIILILQIIKQFFGASFGFKNGKIFKLFKILCNGYFYSAFFFFLSRSLKAKIAIKGRVDRRKVIYFLFITVFMEMLVVFLLA